MSHPLKIRLEKLKSVITKGEIEKVDMVNHIYREKVKQYTFYDEIKTIDQQCWRKLMRHHDLSCLGNIK